MNNLVKEHSYFLDHIISEPKWAINYLLGSNRVSVVMLGGELFLTSDKTYISIRLTKSGNFTLKWEGSNRSIITPKKNLETYVVLASLWLRHCREATVKTGYKQLGLTDTDKILKILSQYHIPEDFHLLTNTFAILFPYSIVGKIQRTISTPAFAVKTYDLGQFIATPGYGIRFQQIADDKGNPINPVIRELQFNNRRFVINVSSNPLVVVSPLDFIDMLRSFVEEEGITDVGRNI